MDAITLVAYTYELGSSLVERCELVRQCHSESSRIAVRTLRVLGHLEGASKEFSGSVGFDASLVELKQALEQAESLVARCQKARGVSAKIGALMRANTLKQELLSVDSDLNRIASDLQIPMLTDIRRALDRIHEKEKESEAAGEVGVDAEVLQQAVRDAIREELHSRATVKGGGQERVDDVIKQNLAQLYEAEAMAAGQADPAPAGGSWPRKLLCPGHNEECVLRTTQKAGPNQGRQFYCCGRSRREQCNMFAWADECDGGAGGGVWGESEPPREHNSAGGDGRLCKTHQEPCAFLRVRKEGPNKGRGFYNCARQGGQRCSSFTWADKKPVAAVAAATSVIKSTISTTTTTTTTTWGSGGSSGSARMHGRAGRGGSSGGDGRLCKGHKEPCALLITKKEGPNKGRPFYACPKPRNESCNHFEWGKRG